MRRHAPRARLLLVGDGPRATALEREYPGHIYAGMRHGEDLAGTMPRPTYSCFPA
jgi:phosphosulfolactate phosphohydrolase-like enzyme